MKIVFKTKDSSEKKKKTTKRKKEIDRISNQSIYTQKWQNIIIILEGTAQMSTAIMPNRVSFNVVVSEPRSGYEQKFFPTNKRPVYASGN